MRNLSLVTIAILGWPILCGESQAAEPPRLRELRIQTVGRVTYFHARFDRPADLWMPDNPRWNRLQFDPAQEPRLVPQDDQTRLVAFLPNNMPLEWNSDPNRRDGTTIVPPPVFPAPGQQGPATSFDFYGQRTGDAKAKLLLLYARTEGNGPGRYMPVETVVEIDFAKAVAAPVPPEAANRRSDVPPATGDLEGWWAVAYAHQLAVLESMSPDFSFYSFARAAIRRRYNFSAPKINRDFMPERDEYRRLYETTTGAAAITESLQLQRMLGQRRQEGPRDVDITKVPGIDIAEHPWTKMMEGRQPDAEPLAKLVPHDNYYLHFKSFAKFVEMGDLLDQWGTTAVRAYEPQATDFKLKERYEKQLCLKTSLLGRTFGPLVIKGLAMTGSDGYLREGSDLAVIFHVVNADLFRAGVEPYLRDARREFGDQLRESKEDYQGVAVESFVTPRREVSLHRAAFDEFIVYANSPAGLRRILDARAGRLKPLADSLDFQYMRTVFKLSDSAEDGFVFLSDAFIRQLVGPASKIKEKRRLEGLTGLHMATNSAIYHAWLYGKPPTDFEALLRAGELKPADLNTPDQLAVTWDGAKQQAVSDRYNTVHFATPLVEIPIDTISRQEEQDYAQFRLQYLGLWRQFFDPVGMRFKMDGEQVRVETYILPLIQSTQYNELRRMAGGGTAPLDASPPTAKTVAQFLTHLSPTAREREEMGLALDAVGVGKAVNWLGEWAIIRFDDSPIYAKLFALSERDTVNNNNPDDWIETIFRMPVTLGVEIKNPLVFAGVLTALRTSLLKALPNAVTWEPQEPAYKGINIVRVQSTPQGRRLVSGKQEEVKDQFLPAAYYALVDGAFYVSLQEQPIKDMIDRAEARKQQPAPTTEAKRVNSALFISPESAVATKEFARSYLEQQVRNRALANASIWYSFTKAGLLEGQVSESARQAVLFRYLGYVPVSPEGAAYVYDPRTDEVTNVRHGSPRRPTPKSAVDKDSPAGQLLEQFRNLNVNLTFREDGIHTTLILQKKK